MKTMNWMLLLAAVSLVAAACSSDTKSSGKPATDVVTAADVAADAAVPTDTKAPSDSVAPADAVTATADAVAPADAVTATAGDKGCTAAADQTYLTSLNSDKAKEKEFGDASLTCTLKKGCLAKTGDPAQQKCIADCLQTLTPLTTNCAFCYGNYSWCAAKKCLAQCAADPLSQACADCRKTNCDPVKDACTAGK